MSRLWCALFEKKKTYGAEHNFPFHAMSFCCEQILRVPHSDEEDERWDSGDLQQIRQETPKRIAGATLSDVDMANMRHCQ